MGEGEGTGAGGGRGTGTDVPVGAAVGGVVAIVFTVILCCVGLPMLVIGIVFIVIDQNSESLGSNDTFRIMGIWLVVVACLLTATGIILIIVVCAGKCGAANKRRGSTQTQSTHYTLTSTQGLTTPQAGHQSSTHDINTDTSPHTSTGHQPPDITRNAPPRSGRRPPDSASDSSTAHQPPAQPTPDFDLDPPPMYSDVIAATGI